MGVEASVVAKPHPHLAEVVTLYESNHRDIVETLRGIADEIEAGEHGDVGCVGLVLLGDELKVYGLGPESEGPSVGMILHAGFMRISRTIEEHGT